MSFPWFSPKRPLFPLFSLIWTGFRITLIFTDAGHPDNALRNSHVGSYIFIYLFPFIRLLHLLSLSLFQGSTIGETILSIFTINASILPGRSSQYIIMIYLTCNKQVCGTHQQISLQYIFQPFPISYKLKMQIPLLVFRTFFLTNTKSPKPHQPPTNNR